MPQKTDAVVASTIGIDTGKNTLHLVGLDDQGTIVLREKLSRSRIASRLANVPRCLIGIEAGMATHYVARELIALGHDVRQVPPAYARPFRQAHKNDFRDAYAIAEAVQRPSTRFVPVNVAPRPRHVCFTPESRHSLRQYGRPPGQLGGIRAIGRMAEWRCLRRAGV
jgi:transposase